MCVIPSVLKWRNMHSFDISIWFLFKNRFSFRFRSLKFHVLEKMVRVWFIPKKYLKLKSFSCRLECKSCVERKWKLEWKQYKQQPDKKCGGWSHFGWFKCTSYPAIFVIVLHTNLPCTEMYFHFDRVPTILCLSLILVNFFRQLKQRNIQPKALMYILFVVGAFFLSLASFMQMNNCFAHLFVFSQIECECWNLWGKGKHLLVQDI